MNTVRKIFASSLVLVTILSVSGFSFNSVKAAAPDMSLIKMTGLSTVYYLKGGKRYVFPNQKTFMTWYANFSNVSTISQSELESYPLGGNVTYRPGVKLVKITTDPKVYAVGSNRTLHSIVSEANAASLWGANWAKMIDDVPDSFFTNYTVGADLTAGKYGEGQLVKMASGADVYYFDGTNFRKFASEAAFTANRFNFANVATAPASMTFTPMGSDITGMEAGLTDTAQGATGGATGTGLSVALSADTPASANLTYGATRVTFTKFNVTASNDGDIVLGSVTVKRSGVGSSTNFDAVYLYDGMTRLTSGQSINSTTNSVTFNNVGVTITKGTTKTLSIVADVATSATSGSNALGIEAASAITAGGATVSGSFPVVGNMMSHTNVQGGSITIAKSGANPLTAPKAGELQAKVAEFRLTAGSIEEVTVRSIALYQVGNISTGNLTNFNLKQAGTTVATATGMTSGGSIILNFTNPFLMAKGAVRTFDLYADVSAMARANDTTRIYLDNSADLYTTGNTYGFGVAVTRTDYDNSADDGTDSSRATIEAGQVTISFQGPAVTDYATQQQDVELFRFTIASQSNIEIRNTYLTLTAGGTDADADNNDEGGLFNSTTANYTDIKFVDVSSGAVVAGPKDVAYSVAADDTSKALTYTDVWNVNAGQTRTIKVTADLANFTPAANETIKATLNDWGGADIKNLATNQYLADGTVVPDTDIAGNTHNVKTGSLAATVAASPSVQTYINGADDIAMTGVNFLAGTGKDVKITSIKFTASGANDCALEKDCVALVKLYDGATQVGDTKQLTSNADPTVIFNNLSVVVTKGTTKTLTVKVDLNTVSGMAGSDETLRFNITTTSTDVTAQDMDGNTVGATGNITGPNHTIAPAGSLSIALAPADAESEARVVLMGKTDEVLGKFKFTAVNEALKLTRVTIELPNGTADDVNSLSLWNGATKVTGDVVVTDSNPEYATFNNFTTDFIVPKDASATLTVKGNLNTVSGGADSGTTITATLATDTVNDNQFEARGVNSNTVLDDDDMTQTDAYNMVNHKTTMTLTEGTLPATTLVNGTEQEYYNFTLTADAAEDIAVKQLIFDVTFTDNTTDDTLTLGSYRFLRGSTNLNSLVDIHAKAGTDLESANLTSGGTGATTAQVIVTFASEEIIAKGTTNTYRLLATSGGFVNGDENDSVTVKLRSDASAQTAGYTYIADADTTAAQKTATLGDAANAMMATPGADPTLSGNDNFIWSDNATVAHLSTLTDNVGGSEGPDSSADWWNTFLVKNLPFTGRTMIN